MNRRSRQVIDFIRFIFPMLFLYVLFFIVPFIQTIIYSFTDYNGINPNKNFIGLANYRKVFQDGNFYNSLKFTILSTVLYLICVNILGYLFALVLNRKIYSRNVIRAIIFCPFIFNNVTVGFIWQFLLGRITNHFYTLTECAFFNVGWISDRKIIIFTVIFVKLWQSAGYFMVIYLAGLQLIPQDAMDAAIIDGGTFLQLIRYIITPLMKPTFFVCIFLAVTESLNMYPMIMTLTNGGPGHASENISLLIYNEAFQNHRMAYASALAVILAVFISLVTVLQMKIMKED